MGNKVACYSDIMDTKTQPPQEGVEVLGYHPLWEDENYNPKGWRVCFQNNNIWCCAVWDNEQDCYKTHYPCIIPTHWIIIPFKP